MTPPNSNPPRAVCLTSGGLDSTTVLALAREAGFEPIPLIFRYGQRHDVEVEHARRIVDRLGLAEATIEFTLPFGQVGGSSLLGDGEVPDEAPEGAGHGGVPSTYVPARNLVFLSCAIAVAEAREIRDVFIGVNALDYSGYPDCRPEFIASFARTADLATRAGTEASDEGHFRIHTPLLEWTKAQIIQRGHELGVDYSATVSCYRADSDGNACGTCESCGLRRRGFEAAAVPDPTRYRSIKPDASERERENPR